MALDLVIAGCLITFCAVVAFRACKRYGSEHPVQAHLGIILSILLAVFIYWESNYDLRWAQMLPHGAVLLFSNASVLLIVCAGGLLFGIKKLSQSRKTLSAAILCTTAFVAISSIVIRPLCQPLHLAVNDNWKDGVCLQSHEASCAPAAAATLLGLHGVEATERQMAGYCFTSQNGTLSLGAFRGVYRGVQGEDLRARALVCRPQEYSTDSVSERLPMLALVDFDNLHPQPNTPSDNLFALLERTRRSQGMGVGRHAVVVVKHERDGNWIVADPAVGKVRWNDNYFRKIWVGEGIYLVSK